MPKNFLTLESCTKFANAEILPHLDNWPGLVILIFGPNFLDWWFFKHELGVDLLDCPLPSLIIFESVILLLSIIYWIIIVRKLPKFGKEEIGILIALTGIDKLTDDELIKLHKKTDSIILSENLNGKIKTKSVPIRLIPKIEKEAHILREKCRAKLIIWGNVDRGNINNQAHTIFIPIFFSYQVKLSQKQFSPLQKNISNLVKQRKWLIADNNNAIDRSYLAENIEEVSLYIIGIVLFFNANLDQSIDLFSKIFKKYKLKQNLSNEDKIAINNIKFMVHSVYASRTRNLQLWSGNKKIEENIKQATVLVQKMKELDFDLSASLVEAQIAFAQRNIPLSKKICQGALKNNPKNPAIYFSLAFLFFYENDLPKAYMSFFGALQNHPFIVGEQFISLARWYIEALNEDPKKEYLNFPLGILYCDLIKDKILATEYLKKFIHIYGNSKDKILTKMTYHAQKRIKKINKQ